ncbi:Lrp/AsnC family transcriptional regulator [Haloarcula laminariae]|uniref:Lrp/AsnC family transcriptional regulator n=1 Tax=Haloarcula laminariae TaxID=2961577 RepID=UPI002405EFB9|nr:Lrp/AsnC family transcriptional regulator [Halomicroarcula sp. FL173]
MDETDLKILQAIASLGTHSPSKVQEETGIPESTIYYRLDKLREKGIIKNDLYDLDNEKLGLGITIIVEVVATYKEGYHHKIGEKLSEIEGVSQVHFTMGERDFVVIAHVPDRKGVERLISDFESVDEVQRTQSKYTITTIKNEPRVVNTYSIESLISTLSTNNELED